MSVCMCVHVCIYVYKCVCVCKEVLIDTEYILWLDSVDFILKLETVGKGTCKSQFYRYKFCLTF